MNKLPVFITAFALLAACSASPSKSLQGKWQGSTMVAAQSASTPEMVEWAKGVSFEFKGEKMTVAVPAEEPRSGKFQIKSAKDGKLVLAVAGEGDEPERVKVKLEGKKKLVWDMGDNRKLVFTRVD